MRFASFVMPHLGGTFSFHRSLRRALAQHGIELDWIGVGDGNALRHDPLWPEESARGFLVDARAPERGHRQAAEMSAAIVRRGYDGVIVNVLTDRIATNLARHLPSHILRLMVIHNITPGTYAAARAVRDHVHAAVGVSERCRSDLVARHGFSPDRTFTIPNAIDLGAAGDIDPTRKQGGGLRVLYLGRIEDASKGVLWLPKILAGVPGATLTVAGDGPDLARLRSAFGGQESRVRFLGRVAGREAWTLLATHDALIMPSRFEGFGLVLAEAMAAGCVPVVSRLRGVTDTIVADGREGLLFPVGDLKEAARLLRVLDRDRDRRDAMGRAAHARVGSEFAADRMGARYAALIHDLAADPPSIAEPLPIADWRLPWGLRAGLRTYLPVSLKNHLRTLRERSRAPLLG